eukprot:TRINITY_DN8635_c0_g1_i1.p1 TRINITY_DN8635_c0_g1~~TRINITY_DN8635_c0_g1_i1.p1  ORF type:complete len:649 (+),score=120.25 TRINITY_DN8635_c0_g1_i1:58-2004(+)
MAPKIEGRIKPDYSRKLSFADFTFGDYVAAEEAKCRQADPNFTEVDPSRWASLYAVLCEPVNRLFKPLECRTLSYWVQCFNAWQGLKGFGKAPGKVNGKQLQQILRIPQEEVNKTLSLFDRKNGQKLVSEHATTHVLEMIKVSPRTIMFAGILISPLIDESLKLKFTLGLFDEEDSGSLDEDQFFELVIARDEASCAVFGAPSSSLTREAVSEMFDLVSKMAAKRLREKAAQDPVAREAIREALKSRQIVRLSPSQKRSLSYSAVQELLTGKDSGSLDWRLLMQRFCGPGSQPVDNLDSSQFKLSHTAPVPIPEGCEIIHEEGLPSRLEVVVVRDAVAAGKDNPTCGIDDIAEIVSASPPFKLLSASRSSLLLLNLVECFDDISLNFQNETSAFIKILRKMYPWAQPKHLRMFKRWCEHYDQLLEKEQDFESKRQALDTVRTNDAKPLIPNHLLLDLKHKFESLADPDARTADIHAIAKYFELDPEDITKTVDVDEDGTVTFQEFLLVTCPPEYKLPDMHTKANRMLRALLEYACNEAQADVQASTNEFTSNGSTVDAVTLAELNAVLKVEEVPEQAWSDWQNLFQELDRNGDGAISVKELLHAGDFDTDVTSVLVSVLDPKREIAFTKERFLAMMLKAHGYYKPDIQ